MKPLSIAVWTPRLRAVSHQAKVWTREISTRRPARAHKSEPANPIYLLAAIGLGIPALLAIPLIVMNPGIQPSAFTNLVAALVVTAFVVAAIFEIKRLADQPADEERR